MSERADEPERCIHCGSVVVQGLWATGEWAHLRGNRYCVDRNGYTASPLQVATPTYHGSRDVL